MNRKLFKSIREYKKESVLAPLFVILEVFMEVLIPLQMAKIIDIGIQDGNLPYIIKMGVILVIMAMLALWFGVKAEPMRPELAQDTQRTCGMTYFTRFRSFPLKTSTIFPHPAL